MLLSVRSNTLADALPVANTRLRNAALIGGFAVLTALAAQIRIPLDFTPVPVTLQTASVLLAGAVLGTRRGAAAISLYVVLGLFFPFYTNGESGLTYVFGATGGYLLGMIVAAAFAGAVADTQRDRRILTALPAMFGASALVYVIGVPWLAVTADLSLWSAFEKGMAPFLIGDVLKAVAAGMLLPAVWHFAKPKNEQPRAILRRNEMS